MVVVIMIMAIVSGCGIRRGGASDERLGAVPGNLETDHDAIRRPAVCKWALLDSNQ